MTVTEGWQTRKSAPAPDDDSLSAAAIRTNFAVGRGLRQTIKDHGPVTFDLIPSAAKRIVGQLYTQAQRVLTLEADEATRTAFDLKDREIARLRHKLARTKRAHHALWATLHERTHAEQPDPSCGLCSASGANLRRKGQR